MIAKSVAAEALPCYFIEIEGGQEASGVFALVVFFESVDGVKQ